MLKFGPSRSERMVFTNGATEAWLAPPVGDYRFRLELVGNGQGDVMATSAPVEVKVVNRP